MTAFQSRPDGEPLRSSIVSQLDYDPETGIFTWKISKRGRGAIAGRVAGTRCLNGYLRVRIDGKSHYLHRLAMLFATGKLDPRTEVDHVNGDRTDNRIANLRNATPLENRRNNAGRPWQRKSKHKGVSTDPRYGTWAARIHHNGKQLHLGTFATEAAAASAYREAALRLHGEFARW